MKIRYSFSAITVLASLILLFGSSFSSAQILELENFRVAPAPDISSVCTLNPTNIDANYFVVPDRIDSPELLDGPTASFSIAYVNSCSGGEWPQDAKEAFDYAISIWANYIASDVPIRIQANWRPLGSNTLGSAGPTRIIQLQGAVENTWYPIAQASAMTGEDIVASIDDEDFDINVNMNCQFGSWYMGTDGNTQPGTIDFVTVLLHEIGHGLGFIGSMNAATASQGSYGFGGDALPIIYDQFTQDGNEIPLLNTSVFPNPSFRLYQALTGQRSGVHFAGQAAMFKNNGWPARIYAPSQWNSGSSYSHLDQATYSRTPNALMRPRMDSNYAMHSPGPVACGMMGDWGWPLGPKCLSQLETDAYITLDAENVDFGVMNVGASSSRNYTISNFSFAKEDLIVSVTLDNVEAYSISSEDADAEISANEAVLNFIIAPGESVTIRVGYNPQEEAEHDARITITHSADNIPNPVELHLTGLALEPGVIARLNQNYPNPFNAVTTIPYVLSQRNHVTINLYTVDGRKVKSLVDETQEPGIYNFSFNAAQFASGVYFYRMVYGDFVETNKMILMK